MLRNAGKNKVLFTKVREFPCNSIDTANAKRATNFQVYPVGYFVRIQCTVKNTKLELSVAYIKLPVLFFYIRGRASQTKTRVAVLCGNGREGTYFKQI